MLNEYQEMCDDKREHFCMLSEVKILKFSDTLRPELNKDEVTLLILGMTYLDKTLGKRPQTPEILCTRDQCLMLAIKLQSLLQEDV
jgi:hypothetical protein